MCSVVGGYVPALHRRCGGWHSNRDELCPRHARRLAAVGSSRVRIDAAHKHAGLILQQEHRTAQSDKINAPSSERRARQTRSRRSPPQSQRAWPRVHWISELASASAPPLQISVSGAGAVGQFTPRLLTRRLYTKQGEPYPVAPPWPS